MSEPFVPAIAGPSAGATTHAAEIALALREVGPLVLRVCRGILHDGPDAEDAAQESLVGLARALPSFRGQCALATFATRIAMRTAMRARARRRPGASTSSVERTDGSPSAELRAIVGSLLDTLPVEQAETLALRFVLGQSPAEIAVTTGVPANTVRSRIRLACEALRRRVEAHPRLRDSVEVVDE